MAGLASEAVFNGAVNAHRESNIPTPAVDPKLIAYRLTVKPDYGKQFTVIYGVNNPNLVSGQRIQMMKTEQNDIVNLSFGIRFAGLFTDKYVVPQEPGFTTSNREAYLRNCYGDNPEKYEAVAYENNEVTLTTLPDGLIN